MKTYFKIIYLYCDSCKYFNKQIKKESSSKTEALYACEIFNRFVKSNDRCKAWEIKEVKDGQ